MKIRSEIVPLPALHELEIMWRALEASCEGSFFTSWGFIGPLLALTTRPPDLFVARRDNDILGLALVAQKSRKSRLGRVDGLTLNQTGIESEDLIYIELNDILCPESARGEVLAALADALDAFTMPWSELCLSGFAEERIESIASPFGLDEAQRKVNPAPWVDLEQVRTEGYLPLLSANTRSQIKRSNRLFEETFGPLSLEIVQSKEDIRANVAKLANLQTTRFEGTSTPSSFTSPFFVRFVETLLLAEPAEQTHADLMRIKAGDTLLGLLVNVCHQSAIANYQCAFAAFPADNRLKPGLVSHAAAIEHYAAEGNNIYHFLGGDQQYKKSLSTGTNQVVWTQLQKPEVRLKLEKLLGTLKARLSP